MGKPLAGNKRANFNYLIEDTIEVGIELRGCEVKSIRTGKASLNESYAKIINGEAWLLNCHIPPYPQGNRENLPPARDRKLLMHRREIHKLLGKVEEKGYTLVPMSMYLARNRVKIKLGVGKAKKIYDKRKTIKERDIKREIARGLR